MASKAFNQKSNCGLISRYLYLNLKEFFAFLIESEADIPVSRYLSREGKTARRRLCGGDAGEIHGG